MATRIRDRWRNPGKQNSIEDSATALGYICWQLALTSARNLHAEDFIYEDDHQRVGVIQEYLAFLGCTEEELTPLEGFAAAGEAQGLAMVAQAASSDEEWDAYEGGYEANMRAHLADHPDDPDAEAFRERMESWSEALRRWGRTTLGFAATLYRRGP